MQYKYGNRESYDLAAQQIKNGLWRVDPEQGLILSSSYWGDRAIGSERGGYLRVRIGYNGKHVSSHRVIWEYVNGPSDLDLTINHIDGNGLNNKIDNLELISNGDNIRLAYKTHLAGGRTKQPFCQYGHPFDGSYTDSKGYPHQQCSICNRLTVWGRNNGMTLEEALKVRPNGEPLPKVENPNCKYGHNKQSKSGCYICSRLRSRAKSQGLTFEESLQKWPDEKQKKNNTN